MNVQFFLHKILFLLLPELLVLRLRVATSTWLATRPVLLRDFRLTEHSVLRNRIFALNDVIFAFARKTNIVPPALKSILGILLVTLQIWTILSAWMVFGSLSRRTVNTLRHHCFCLRTLEILVFHARLFFLLLQARSFVETVV